jgi:hypothetical protein
MLPGFRFLFAAIVLSMSILVFGLGAAALLRAAHEEFASNPSWRGAPETIFAQPAEPTRPVLAILRVDTPVMEKAPDNAPANAAAAAVTSTPDQPERITAQKPEDSPPPGTAKPEVTVAESRVTESRVTESPAESEAAPAPAEVPAAVTETRIAEPKIAEAKIAETKITETNVAETKIAETKIAETRVAMPEEAALPADRAAIPFASAPADPQIAPDANIAATKIATLGGAPVAIETQPRAKVASAKPDARLIRKRRLARRAALRRRLAEQARLAAAQLPPPFGPQAPAPTIVHRR